MPNTTTRIAAPEWASVLAELDITPGASVLIAGDRAGLVADELVRAGAPPLASSGDRIALLSESDLASVEDGDAGATGLPSGSVDTAIVRHAWSGIRECGPVLAEMERILRPGGTIVAADLDWRRLLDAAPLRYPARILYDRRPALAARLAATSVTPAELGMLVTREFRNVHGIDVDETLGRFPNAAAYSKMLHRHGWRGMELLEDEDAARFLEEAAKATARIAAGGAVVEREPWRVLAGTKPA
jgi:hypothetical protein